MTEFPPPNEGLEDVDERYRRLSDRDSSRPGDAIRRAVLRHAAELAAQARTQESSAPIEVRRSSAKEPRWRVATYGGLAAAALGGLLIAPHFITPSTAPMARTAPMAPLSPPPTHTGERAEESAAAEQPVAAEQPTARAAPAKPRALAGNVRPSQNPALGAVAGDDVRRAPMPQDRARENAPAPLAQMQTMAAPSAARAMASSPAPAAPSLDTAAALREAAQSGNVQKLQALLAGRIYIDARDSSGRTALMLAVLHDQKEAVNSLLEAGADPNAADSSGTTPLGAAVAGTRPEIAAALRQAGAR
jgi:hypothetical protein